MKIKKRLFFLRIPLIVLVSLGVIVTLGFHLAQYVRYVQAVQACPLPLEVHGQYTLTPTSAGEVFDCSTLDIVIASDGEVIVERYITSDTDRSNDGGAVLSVRNLTVNAGGKITATGKGYRPGEADNGTGNGGNGIGQTAGSGGANGGAGGEGTADGINPPGNPGVVYGNQENPRFLGGAGGNTANGAVGGYGGGSIELQISETFTLNGTVEADGLQGNVSGDGVSGAGGGAGGSILIEAGTLAGNGLVSAKGAGAPLAQYQGGGGGGGRIQMFANIVNNYTGQALATAGITDLSQDGGIGSKLGPTTRPSLPTDLKQFRNDLTTQIALGGATAEANFYVAGAISDPDSTDLLFLDAEVREVGTSFTNQVTHASSLGLSNPQSCSGDGNSCGRVSITGLPRSAQYHWQVRVRDNKGGVSAWVPFGGNGENETDIQISGEATTIVLIEGQAQSAVVNTNIVTPFKVRVTDTNSVPVVGYALSWSVYNGANGGALLGSVTTITDANGEATNTYRLGKTAGTANNIVRATATGLTGSPVSFTASGLPADLSYFTVTAPSVALVNTNFQATITAYDQYANVKTDFADTVSFQAVNPLNTTQLLSGIFTPADYLFIPGDAGIKTIDLAYDTLESIKLKVSSGSAVGYSLTIAVVNALGACPDADGIIDANQTWAASNANSGIFDCRGLTVRVMNNAVLSLPNYINVDTNYDNDINVTLLADSLIVEAGSSITATGTGYTSNTGPGKGVASSQGSGGASYGGYGGTGNTGGPGTPYGGAYAPIMLGSGGGPTSSYAGGAGGGAMRFIVSGTTSISGTISTNGNTGASQCKSKGGGGSGGSIWIETNILEGAATGLITANGGNGIFSTGSICGSGSGAGSGGRIAIYYATNNSFPLNTNTVQARGGTGGQQAGGPGTVYVEQTGVDTYQQGKLFIDNNSVNVREAVLIESTYVFDQISMTRYGHLTVNGDNSVLTIVSEAGLFGDATASKLVVNGTLQGPENMNINGLDIGVKGAKTGLFNLNIGLNGERGGFTFYERTWAHNTSATGFVFGNVAVGNLSNLTLAYGTVAGNYSDEVQVTFNSLEVQNGGTVTLPSMIVTDTNWTNDYGVRLMAGSIDLQTGGVITATGGGYPGANGPGKGANGSTGAAGGSYGGYGGNGNSSVTGEAYGTVYTSNYLGSGGGTGGVSAGGAAGGSLRFIVSGAFTLNGSLTANGNQGGVNCQSRGGGGSGGSVWIDTNILAGTAGSLIQTNGGNGTYDGGNICGSGSGGGSGGRIAIYYATNNGFPINMTAIQSRGGTGGQQAGGPGTIYIEQTGVDNYHQGKLYVNNNGVNSREAVLIEGSYVFDKIIMTSYGHLTVNGQNSLLMIVSETGLEGDATASKLVVNGTIMGPDNMNINGLDIGVKGAKEGLINLNIGLNGERGGFTFYEKTWAHNTSTNGFVFGNVAVGNLSSLTLAYGTVAGNYSDEVQVTFNSLEVQSGGTVTLPSMIVTDTNWTNDYGVRVIAASIDLQAGGIITANGGGFPGANGAGTGVSGQGGGGGSYGGYAGVGNSSGIGEAYGGVYTPTLLGSGGGNGSSQPGGAGGGSLHFVVSGTLNASGTIRANGNVGGAACWDRGGGGSGGSILIETATLAGGANSIISANGGAGTYSSDNICGGGSGAGSGGRIAIYYATNNGFPINMTAIQSRGGTGGQQAGGPGTIYIEQTGVDTTHQAKLYVDNNGVNSREAVLIEDTYVFDRIYLTNYGHLSVNGQSSYLTLLSDTAIQGDATAPKLISNGTLEGPATMNINGVDVGVKGDKVGLTNLNIGLNGERGGFTIYEKTWAHNTSANGFVFGNVVVGNTSGFTLAYGTVAGNYSDEVQVTFNSLEVQNGATVTLPSMIVTDTNWTNDYGVRVIAASIDLQAGGIITANGGGFPAANGAGTGVSGQGGGGGSYGGYAGVGNSSGIGEAYGGVYTPTLLGSGGGNGNSQPGGAGGGSLHFVVSGTLNASGTIRANGNVGGAACWDRGGGGSGGSILIETATLAGGANSIISANGGAGTYSSDNICGGGSGAGSGGRIAIYYVTNSNFPINMTALQSRGGTGGQQAGGPGTIYIEQTGVDTLHQAKLYVDNNGVNSREAVLIEDTYIFDRIHLTNYGHLSVNGQNSYLTLLSDTAVQGDATAPRLVSNGTLEGPVTMNINGVDVGVKGDKVGLTNINIGLNGERGGFTFYEKTWAHNTSANGFVFGNVVVGNASNLTLAYGTVAGTYTEDIQVTFNRLEVQSGATVTLPAMIVTDTNWSNDYGVRLIASEVDLQTGGVITAAGRGYPASNGAGKGGDGASGAGGASYGGYAGVGNSAGILTPYGSIFEPTQLGSGGGTGGNAAGGTGGGSMRIIVSNTFTLNGTLNANGNNGAANCQSRGGGGSGGSIWIETATLAGGANSLVTANGGNGTFDGDPICGSGSGSGSGGRIAIYYATNNGFSFGFSTLQSRGGTGGQQAGGPGTVYIEQTGVDPVQQGSLYLDNNAVSGRSFDLEPVSYSFKDVKIGTNVYTYAPGSTSENRGTRFLLAGDFSLGTGSKIDGFAAGFSSDAGPGTGEAGQNLAGGGGGASGGSGGAGQSDGTFQAQGGNAYNTENQMQPLMLGSGGGRSGAGTLGGKGGGAVSVEAPNGFVQIQGTIDVNGEDGKVASPGGGGGGGGSIYVVGNTCDISGSLLAEGGDGGDGDYDGGGGGGGRIAIVTTGSAAGCEVTGTVSVLQGLSVAGSEGQVGTYGGVFALPIVTLDDQRTLADQSIALGAEISGAAVKLVTSLSDPDATELSPKTLITNIQIVRADLEFTDASVVNFNSSQVVHTGGPALQVITESPAVLQKGVDYKWRARAYNVGDSVAGNWLEYGNNGNNPDFSVSATTGFNVELSRTKIGLGDTLTVTVSARDGGAQVVPGYSGTISFSAIAGATQPGDYTFLPADNGIHEFTNAISFNTVGTYQISVTDTLDNTLTGTSINITVVEKPVITADTQRDLADVEIPVGGLTPGTTAKLVVSLSDINATAGTPKTLLANFEVVAINLDYTDPSAVTFNSAQTVVSDGNAVQIVTQIPGSLVPGTNYKWRARVLNSTDTIYSNWVEFANNGNNTDFGITAAAGFQVAVSKTVVGVLEQFSVTVTAVDGLGATDTGYTGTVQFSLVPAGGAGTVIPANYTFTAGDNGVHTFTNAVAISPVGTYHLSVVDTINASLTGDSVNVTVLTTPTATAHKQIDMGNIDLPHGDKTPGATIKVEVGIQDDNASNLNPRNIRANVEVVEVGKVFGDAGTISVNSNTILVNDNNEHTVIVQLPNNLNRGTDYKWRVRTENTDDNIVGDWVNYVDATDTIDFGINAIVGYSVIINPSTIGTGETVEVTVTAVDNNGNPDTEYLGTIDFGSNPVMGVELPADYTFVAGDNGSQTFTVRINEPGTFTIDVVDTINPGLTGTSPNITVLEKPVVSLLEQRDLANAVIPIGELTTGAAVKLIVSLNDPNASGATPKSLQAYYQVTKTSSIFGEAGTIAFSSSVVNYTGGGPISVTTVTPGSLENGAAYKWRVRAYNVTDGVYGDWLDFGNNGDAADFRITNTAYYQLTPSKQLLRPEETTTLTLQALTSGGVTDTTYNGTVTFSVVPVTATGVVLPANYKFSLTDQGLKEFVNSLSFFSVGTYRIYAEDTINSAINGLSAEITVVKPVITLTPTPVLTVTPSITQEPTETVTTTPVPCSVNPFQPECLEDVKIKNLTIRVSQDKKEAEVCFDTNTHTVGHIKYGEDIYTEITEIEEQYKTEGHCIMIKGLKEDKGYKMEVIATSKEGKEGKINGSFAIGSGLILEGPAEACITTYPYQLSGNIAQVTFETIGNGQCQVTVHNLGMDNEQVYSSELEGKLHSIGINLNDFDLSKDIVYVVNCDVLVNEETRQCKATSMISQAILPETGIEFGPFSGLWSTIAQILVLLAVSMLLLEILLNLFTYPRFFLYGFYWITGGSKQKPWGIVYDAVKKTPVAFAVLRLYEASTGRLIKESVSSLDGKYGFTVDRGDYLLTIEHSEYVKEQRTVTVERKEGMVALDIALATKEEANRNNRLVELRTDLRERIAQINTGIVIAGFLLSLISYLIARGDLNFILLILYGIQFLVILLLKYRSRYWGTVIDMRGNRISGAFVRLYHIKEGRQLDVVMADTKGRYRFLTRNGRYLLGAYAPGHKLQRIEGELYLDEKNDLRKIKVSNGVVSNNIWMS